MGTINYYNSDYITVGYDCNNIDYEDQFSVNIVSDYYDQVKYTLEKQRFYYFHVSLEPGYYEGFSINIEFNFKWCFDCWQDKREAQKEVTQIKAFLLECINNFECVSVYPGWCTGYADYKTTLNDLDEAIKEMRADIRKTPTFARLPASEKYA